MRAAVDFTVRATTALAISIGPLPSTMCVVPMTMGIA
jgi:hypothetical protein